MRPMHDNICFQGIDLDSPLKGDMLHKVSCASLGGPAALLHPRSCCRGAG